MKRAREKELQKLKEILKAKLAGPKHVHFLKEDDDIDLDGVQQKLIDDGVISASQEVTFISSWRWPGFVPSKNPVIDPRGYGRDTRSLEEAIQGCPIPSDGEEIVADRRYAEPEEPPETPRHLWRISYPKGSVPV